MRRFGLCSLILSLSLVWLLPGCGGGIEPGMATNVDKKPLEPGPETLPNMSGPSTATPPAK
jgi:hypothetical protein